MPRWEYWVRTVRYRPSGGLPSIDFEWPFKSEDVDYVDEEGINDYLDKIGQHGWELVSVVPIADPPTQQWKLFFKRPKE